MKKYLLITALIGGSVLGMMPGLGQVSNEKLKTMYVQIKKIVEQDQEEINKLATLSPKERQMEIQMLQGRSTMILQQYAMIGGELVSRGIDRFN